MKRLTCSIICFIILASLLSGALVKLSSSNENVTFLYFAPETIDVNLGESFIINVNVKNVKDLNKWELGLSWDSNIIELDSFNGVAVEEGPFLKTAGATKFEVSSYTKGSGVLQRVSCYLIQAKGVSGEGTLFKVRFKAISSGKTNLIIRNSKLYDYVFRSILHTVSLGQVSVISVLRDISIVSLESPKEMVLGSSACLNVTVENKGKITENNVKIELYVNGTSTGSITIPNILANFKHTCKIDWTPSKAGFYNITIFAPQLPGETAIDNNKLSSFIYVKSHDLKVTLQCPFWVNVDSTVLLNVTVTNIGDYKEESVRLLVKINDVNVVTWNNLSFDVGESKTFNYLWTASVIGQHKITAYVEPCGGEIYTANNQDIKKINVIPVKSSFSILIVSDDDSGNRLGYERGTSLTDFMAILDSVGYKYDVWVTSSQGHPSLEFLLQYELVIWTCGDFVDYQNMLPDKTDCKTLEEYFYRGGNIIIEGQRICWNRVYIIDRFASDVLHLTYSTSIESSPLEVVNSAHPIATNLPTIIPWIMEPMGYADGVRPVNGGEKVIAYADMHKRGAVIAFDGKDQGTGSVVVYSFPLYWMPDNERATLVLNSIRWLTHLGIEKVIGKILNSPFASVYFVYADPQEAEAITFDAAAGAMIYSKSVGSKFQGFTTTRNWILPSGKINGTEIKDSIVVIVGNPLYNPVINYYESINLASIRSCDNSTHFMFIDSFGRVIGAISKREVEDGRQDLMVIQVFKDQNNIILSMYGYSWKGTWATGIYFSEYMAKNLKDFTGTYCVLKWYDNDVNEVPDPHEIEILELG